MESKTVVSLSIHTSIQQRLLYKGVLHKITGFRKTVIQLFLRTLVIHFRLWEGDEHKHGNPSDLPENVFYPYEFL